MYPYFTSSYIQPIKYNNVTNLLKTTQENYHTPFSSSFQSLSPHYITLEDGTIFSELLQQEDLFPYNHSNHNHNANSTNEVHEQFSSHNIDRASQHSNEGKCSNNNGDNEGSNKPKSSNTRRASKKNDRHSKISTAQGLRDRRMRLSLDVARKFFKLQDVLGFDKASETVDWLLTKSKSNILELIHQQRYSKSSGVSNSSSSTSKWELFSENIEDDDQKAKSSSSSNRKERKKATRLVRKSSYLLRPRAKETREMARKRARERTMEKSSKLCCVSGGDDQISKSITCLDQEIDHQDSNHLSSWIINQPEHPSSQFQFNQGLVCDDSLSMTSNWNPSFVFNYQHAGVQLPHEQYQLNDFHILGNSWDEGRN